MTEASKKTAPEDLPPPSQVRRGLGWRPEVADHRDHIYRAPRVKLADRVDPIGQHVRIHDQGMLGSCTGHASTTMLEVYFRKLGIDIRTGNALSAQALISGSDAEQQSRLMAYYTGRDYIGETKVDNGAYNRDVIKGLLNIGVAPETSWPYTVSKVFNKPTATAYKKAAALRDRIKAMGLVYESVPDLGALLGAVNAGQPVMIGFTCYNSIFDLNEKNYMLPMPAAGEPPVGGHAVCVDGYSMPDQYVDIINSWSPKWGNKGRFRMPFSYIEDPSGLVDDMWTLRKP